MKRRVLLIDDDLVTHTIVKGVINNDLDFSGCFTLAEAEDWLLKNNPPHLFIIDRVLPDGDGLSICSTIRSNERLREVPIIFLSSKSSETDKVGGLYAGADDYISKPVSPLELKARIQARLRSFSNKLNVGKLSIDLGTHRVILEEVNDLKTEIELTRIEFKLLVALSGSPDRIFSRDQLMSQAWGSTTHISDRVIDAHLSHLRKKILKSGLLIESVRGEGYRLYLSSGKKNQAA
jgi:DNA-binding response OmpR family regulator